MKNFIICLLFVCFSIFEVLSFSLNGNLKCSTLSKSRKDILTIFDIDQNVVDGIRTYLSAQKIVNDEKRSKYK